MEIKVFTHAHFGNTCDKETFALLVKRFAEYKRTGIPHETFGRDTTYNRPASVRQADLRHIHIKDQTSNNWHLKKLDFFNMKSNTALIYCEGFYRKDHFLLLSFLKNAHEYCRENPLYLCQLADLAEKFRSKY